MNHFLKLIIYAFVISFVMPGVALAQKKFKLEAYSHGGKEYNIFKSPERLFDRPTGQYADEDSLLVSDFFVDFGYDAKYSTKKKKKYYFEVGSDFWYRKYFEQTNNNQNILSFNTMYEKVLGKKVSLGVEYDFSWNNKIGTSVSGDELLRSFKYLGNRADLYVEYRPNKKLTTALLGAYQYKHYYEDTTDLPLDHVNMDANFLLEYELNKANAVVVDAEFTDRKYKYYPAANQKGNRVVEYNHAGNLIDGYPLRHFQYYKFALSYAYKPAKRLLLSPSFNYTIRDDLYEDYYSYTSYSPGFKVRYLGKKFYAMASAGYRQVKYEQRYAYTIIENTDLLTYDYLKYKVKLKYKVFNPVELFFNFSMDNRDANTELEHARTRRPYNNYEFLFGVNVEVFDYKSKKSKDKKR